jgi:hypothetical protein
MESCAPAFCLAVAGQNARYNTKVTTHLQHQTHMCGNATEGYGHGYC